MDVSADSPRLFHIPFSLIHHVVVVVVVVVFCVFSGDRSTG